MMTAATSAKIAMQITVTNQKTKSIRPACLLAGSGSQGMKIATRAATPPQTIPMATSWATDPLRTARETTRRRGLAPLEVGGEKRLQRSRFWKVTKAGTPVEQKRRFDGTRSQHSSYCGRRDPRVGRECRRLRRQHPHGRLDLADRGDRGGSALDDLLVVLGRARLPAPPPGPRLRQRRPPALLDQ